MRRMLVLSIAAAVLVLAVAIWVFSKRSHSGAFVIGQEMKNASDAEQRRLARGASGPSPLPPARYDSLKGDANLIVVPASPVDDGLRAACQDYRELDEVGRADFRDRIDMDELYMLLQFAKRSSVLAIREQAAARVREGFTALAMIDIERIDPRDFSHGAALVAYAAEKLGADPAAMVAEASLMSSAETTSYLRGVLRHVPVRLSDWLVEEVETNDGVGLIGTGVDRYRPTMDLTGAAIRVAARLSNERYNCNPSIKGSLPPVWFHQDDSAAAQKLIEKSLGVATVRGDLNPEVYPRPVDQMMVVFMAEMPSEEDANALASLRPNALGEQGAVQIVRVGKIVCVIVGRSVVMGKPGFETPESLEKIATTVRETLLEADL